VPFSDVPWLPGDLSPDPLKLNLNGVLQIMCHQDGFCCRFTNLEHHVLV